MFELPGAQHSGPNTRFWASPTTPFSQGPQYGIVKTSSVLKHIHLMVSQNSSSKIERWHFQLPHCWIVPWPPSHGLTVMGVGCQWLPDRRRRRGCRVGVAIGCWTVTVPFPVATVWGGTSRPSPSRCLSISHPPFRIRSL